MAEITETTGNQLKSVDSAFSILARGKLSVLLFHAVPRTTTPLVQDLTLPSFERIIDFVSDHFNVMPLDDAVSKLGTGALPARAAAITFDDGYDSWLDGAAPLLLQRNLHATFFITTGQFDDERMWHERLAQALAHHPGPSLDLPGLGLPKLALASLLDRQHALGLIEQLLKYQRLHVREQLLTQLERAAGTKQSQLPRMTAEQLRQLHAQGFGIGAHTVRHPILSLCDRSDALHEIGSARETLEHIVRGSVRAFAYPNGRPGVDFDRHHVQMVRSAGYTYAVTTESGAANAQTPLFEIPRFTPWGPTGTQMGLQLARNLLARPRYVSGSTRLPPAATPPEPLRIDRPLVAFVENGAGFGGAIVALQTLLRNSAHTGFRYQVVSNMPIGDFGAIPTVERHRVIPDRSINYRRLARGVRERLGSGVAGRSLMFLLGRMDDLTNRLPYFCRLLTYMVRTKPAVIHGNNDPTSNREAMLVAKLLGIPYVQHVRGAVNDSLQSSLLRNGPAVFVPVSRWLAGELLLAGVPAERVRHIYDGVELAAAAPPAQSLRTELGLSPETALVAMVGMLVPWKGQELFLDAVAQLRERSTQTAFLLIGGTPERGDVSYAQHLHHKIQQLGLENTVHVLGRRHDLATLLPQIEVCVSASTTPEPLGLIMLEAMTQGSLFVGPAFGAASEIVEDGQTGFLFEPGSASSLADRLMQALDRAGTVGDETAGSARDLVENWFSGPRCAEATSGLYDRLHPCSARAPAVQTLGS